MPRSVAVSDTFLLTEKAVVRCGDVAGVRSVLGVDRNGQMCPEPIEVKRTGRSVKGVFLGSKMCFGMFSEHSTLVLAGGGNVKCGAVVDPYTGDDYRFEAPLASLGGVEIAATTVRVLVAALATSRASLQTAIVFPIRDKSKVGDVPGGRIAHCMRKPYWIVERDRLDADLRSRPSEVCSFLMDAHFVGQEADESLFELLDQTTAFSCISVLGRWRMHSVCYDNKQHTVALVVKRAANEEIQMRLACSFFSCDPAEEWSVAWERQGWSPILNGWIAGRSAG